MNKRSFSALFFAVLSSVSLSCAHESRQNRVEEVPALPSVKSAEERPKSNAVVLPGVKSVEFSQSGNFAYFQLAESFRVHKTSQKLTAEDFFAKEPINGNVLGFLPSDIIAYTNTDQLYLYDPNTQQSRKVDIEGRFSAADWSPQRRGLAIVSDDLILSGDGSYDWGGEKGNILRLDIKDGSVTRGAKIPGFWYPALSADKKYLMFQYGAEANNNSYLYEIDKDKNTSFSDYFSLRRNFPAIKLSDEVPIIWLDGVNRLLAVVSTNMDDESNGDQEWLTLLDADTRTVVWKVKTNIDFFPTDVQLINENLALISRDAKVFELNLRNGNFKPIVDFRANPISVSPDRNSLAFLESDALYVTDLKGEKRKKIYSLESAFRTTRAYREMGTYAPKWSPNMDAIFVIGEKETVVVNLK